MESKSGIIYKGELLSQHIRSKRVIDPKNHILLSSANAAKQIGISKATMSRTESGEVVDVRTLYAICKWLNKPMENYFSKTKK